jgi:hypothetical protein
MREKQTKETGKDRAFSSSERSIPRGLAFTGTSPISRDDRHTAVRSRFSLWKQSVDFRGGDGDSIVEITAHG